MAPEAALADNVSAAKEAGLHYVRDDPPGYTRRRGGHQFKYFDTEGKPIRDQQRLLRIKRLAIPPAWSDVWICPSPSGHIQVTGRDARRRKQYRYHDRWRKSRDETKFGRLAAFAPHAKIIHVDIDPAEIGKNRAADIPIVGDVKKVLEKLNAELRDYAGTMRKSSGNRCATAGADFYSHRQRGVRAKQQIIRLEYDKGPTCDCAGRTVALSFSRKEWAPA